jgi:phospholipid transport system substrate-binding protein
MTRKLIIIVFIACFGTAAIISAAGTPTSAIQSTVDAVLDTMRDSTLKLPDKKQERRDRIRALIRDRFDFKEMSKRSLAKHWKKRTPEEKKEFIRVFSELLESSYIGRIEEYTDEKILYNKETIKGKGKYGIVNTAILAKSVDIPIDYKVINKNNKWWVYDVVIEGVSFISTYRSQYNKIIIKKSYSQLIKDMTSKLNEINTQDKEKGS